MQTAGAGASASELLDATQSIPTWRLRQSPAQAKKRACIAASP
jgi:hypothetical protein